MVVNEKILNALKLATNHLENSMLAFNKKDENLFADSLWHTAAELEYTLFLLSMKFSDESDLSKWKPNPELKKVETSSMLAEAKDLLNKAETYMANEKSMDVYKSAYVARHYILKVQEDLAKKKRDMLKKK